MTESRRAADMPARLYVLSVAAIAAIVSPVLLAFNAPPSSTFGNQAAAVVGWGLFLAAVLWASRAAASLRWTWGEGCLLASAILVAGAALASSLWSGLPSPMLLSTVAVLSAAVVVLMAAVVVGQTDSREPAFAAFCWALTVAGFLSSVIGLVQIHFPQWTGDMIAAASNGRAAGNLRQPNHLSSLLLWSVIALLWLKETGRVPGGAANALALLFVYVIWLAASRTGAAGMLLLGLWGCVDPRLSRKSRAWLVILAGLYVGLIGLDTLWSAVGHDAMGASGRLASAENLSSGRLSVWTDTVALIRSHPWTGVGFGEFNFAWSLTAFPQRHYAFFDHTHNLPLQLLVEFGIPAGLLVMILLVVALARAGVVSWSAQRGSLVGRTALVMVIAISLHSMTEYPLWYLYFLLPAVFAFGISLSSPTRATESQAGRFGTGARALRWGLFVSALALSAGGALAIVDYGKVAIIFSSASDSPLEQRIEDGKRSWFFSQHAHYAAATMAEHPSQVMPSFDISAHHLLDTRLMMAWSKAFAERGDIERARYLADRLREFRNPDSDAFFAECAAATDLQTMPYQCARAAKTFSFADFR